MNKNLFNISQIIHDGINFLNYFFLDRKRIDIIILDLYAGFVLHALTFYNIRYQIRG